MDGIGKIFYAHELLRFDFEQIKTEAKRQEKIHSSNKGELAIAQSVYDFFNNIVIPLIISETSVFEAALILVDEYIQTYFNVIRLSGDQTHTWQQNLLKINDEVVEMIAKMGAAGKAPNAGKVNLPKASDFIQLILLDKLTIFETRAVNNLHQRAMDQEEIQLTLTLQNIGNFYEVGLPRVMFVVRKALKYALSLKSSQADNTILQPSDYLDWFTNNCDKTHPLFPIIGDQSMQAFYKAARNVGNHHAGLKWDRGKNIVILKDKRASLEIPLHDFQKYHRYLVYLIDYGVRAILAAFCEAEQGNKANKIYSEYDKIFPSDFPSGAGKGVMQYPEG